jgi:hypothetical protein
MIPTNIVLHPRPAYSPELNPQEKKNAWPEPVTFAFAFREDDSDEESLTVSGLYNRARLQISYSKGDKSFRIARGGEEVAELAPGHYRVVARAVRTDKRPVESKPVSLTLHRPSSKSTTRRTRRRSGTAIIGRAKTWRKSCLNSRSGLPSCSQVTNRRIRTRSRSC